MKTQKLIKSGEYIVEYVGEVVTDKEFKNRMTSLYKNDIHHYCLNLEGGLLIDGHRMGSDGELLLVDFVIVFRIEVVKAKRMHF